MQTLGRFSHVRLFVTLWNIVLQAPLSIGFSRQEYWRGFPCPPPGNLPNPGIKPTSLTSPALAGMFLTTSTACCSVAQPCPALCNPMDCLTQDFPVLHHFPELAQTHGYWVSDAIQPYRPLLFPSPPAFDLSQHQSLFQWVSSSHYLAQILEFQLQHQSLKWVFRVDFL